MTTTPPFPGLTLAAFLDAHDIMWRLGNAAEVTELLAEHHYLGPLRSGGRVTVLGEAGGRLVAAQVWKNPTARNLPNDGSWLELARWCLTPDAGKNAGSRMHRWAIKLIREHAPSVTTLVSYSDPEHGHTGALYRACNWQWAPTWHRLRTPPTGNGDWGTGGRQAPKDRWVFCIKPDARRAEVLAIDDAGAVRYWQARASEQERAWARSSLNMRGAVS